MRGGGGRRGGASFENNDLKTKNNKESRNLSKPCLEYLILKMSPHNESWGLCYKTFPLVILAMTSYSNTLNPLVTVRPGSNHTNFLFL